MFLKHFKMVSAPFERDIPSKNLFESKQCSEALARLLYVCGRRTMAVVTGEPGAGKSTLLRMLKNKLDSDNYLFVYIADSNLSPRNFYSYALAALTVEQPGQLPKLKMLFKDTVTDFFETKGITCVLVVDDAQTLELSMLQELRFIMNFKVDSFSPMAFILAGQPEFKATLQTLHMAPIWRRIDTSYQISGMDYEETKAYIVHQLNVAGCSRPLFPDDVISNIHKKAKGISVVINTLCKGCLIDAAAREQELINMDNLNRVLNDLF